MDIHHRARGDGHFRVDQEQLPGARVHGRGGLRGAEPQRAFATRGVIEACIHRDAPA